MNWKTIEQGIRRAIRNEKGQLPVRDTAEYPLAFNVGMPEGHPYRNGNISFRFYRFACRGIRDVHLDTARCLVGEHRLRLCLQWRQLRLTAAYSINASEAPVIDLDTAGNLLGPADQSPAMATAGAGSKRPPALTVGEQNAFLDNARAQRTRLMDTPNGQQLMGVYNEHNEVYNEVFVTSEAARNSWYADGATAQMAKDTHAAVGGNGVVNSSTKMYGRRTYNSNSFLQQLNICVNSVNADPNFNAWDPNATPDPNSKYVKAALATLSFAKAVKTTGNDDKKVTEMTADQVYGQVNTFSQPIPVTGVDELQHILSQGTSGAGGPQGSSGAGGLQGSSGAGGPQGTSGAGGLQGTSGAGAGEAPAGGWMILDEEQRKMVRHWIHLSIREKARARKNKTRPLWKGKISADIPDVTVVLDWQWERDPATAEMSGCELDLPVFQLDIDDSAWQGPTADIVRQRLARVQFVKSLIAEQIASGIKTLSANSTLHALRDR